MKRRPFVKLLIFLSSLIPFKLFSYDDNNKLVVFNHGVASGDPTNTNVVIWTKITTTSKYPIKILWEVSSDCKFNNIIASGYETAKKSNDYCIKADPYINKSFNNKTIYYRFSYKKSYSPVGKSKTLPIANPNEFNIAFCSCSNYPAGFFNAYKEIANNADIDLVLHLGDYLYEYDDKGYASEDSIKLDRVVDPLHEIISLNDYRKRHALYKTDPDLQLLHSNKPMIAVWDDHEFTNDSWKEGAENHSPNEGSFKKRKANALKAYYEWMPIREPKNKLKIWRKFEIGTLFQLFMLDTRSIYREKQINLDDYFINNSFDKDQYKTDLNKQRVLVGNEQFKWLDNAVDSKFNWTIIGQQVLVSEVVLPSIFSKIDKSNIPSFIHKYLNIGGLNIPYNTDAWDGYPNERDKLFKILNKTNSSIVLTGDTHNSWAANLFDKNNKFVGIELGAPSISSPNTIDTFKNSTTKIEKGFINENKNIKWTDGSNKGFVLLNIKPSNINVSFKYVSTVKSKIYEAFEGKTFNILPKTNI